MICVYLEVRYNLFKNIGFSAFWNDSKVLNLSHIYQVQARQLKTPVDLLYWDVKKQRDIK